MAGYVRACDAHQTVRLSAVEGVPVPDQAPSSQSTIGLRVMHGTAMCHRALSCGLAMISGADRVPAFFRAASPREIGDDVLAVSVKRLG